MFPITGSNLRAWSLLISIRSPFFRGKSNIVEMLQFFIFPSHLPLSWVTRGEWELRRALVAPWWSLRSRLRVQGHYKSDREKTLQEYMVQTRTEAIFVCFCFWACTVLMRMLFWVLKQSRVCWQTKSVWVVVVVVSWLLPGYVGMHERVENYLLSSARRFLSSLPCCFYPLTQREVLYYECLVFFFRLWKQINKVYHPYVAVLGMNDGHSTVLCEFKKWGRKSDTVCDGSFTHKIIWAIVHVIERSTWLSLCFLLFLDVPDPPGKPLVMGFTSRSVNLSWTPPLNAHNSPVSHYLIHVRVGEDGEWDHGVGRSVVETPDNATVFRVLDLQPFTTYSFRVTAVNAMGDSEPSKESYYMLTLREGKRDGRDNERINYSMAFCALYFF